MVRLFGGIPERLTPDTRFQPYLIEYIRLRELLRLYVNVGTEPKLSWLDSYRGSLAYLRIWLNKRGVDVDSLDVDSDAETDIEIV